MLTHNCKIKMTNYYKYDTIIFIKDTMISKFGEVVFIVNIDLFSKRLASLLETKKMTKGKLASYIDQTTGSISRYINKERIPSEEIIIKIAYFLRVNPCYLKGFSNEITPPSDIKEEYLTVCKETIMINDKLSIFSRRLKILVDESGKKQKEIAFDLNISKGVFSNYINSKREPDFNTLRIICNYFNVSSDYLLGISYSKNREEETNLKNKLVDILKQGNILDLASEYKQTTADEKLFIQLLKHTCETFKIIKKSNT